MNTKFLQAALVGGLALSLTACAKAGDPLVDSTVDQARMIPAALDANGKVTIPPIYRLYLISYGENGDTKDVWINVDERVYAACVPPTGWPACKQGIEGIE